MTNMALGIDIGISSVGVGIINQDTGEIIDSAVRIFPQNHKEDNTIRRTMRGSKRTLRRKKHRLERVRDELENIDFPCPDYKKYSHTNPYEIRVKGLNHKLSKEEIYIAIMHITKRRGISYLEDFTNDNIKDPKVTNKIIEENLELSKNKYICEIQLERLQNNDKVRGIDNVFETRKYIEELQKILKTQAIYYEEIDDEFINVITNIVKSKREYFEGPGSSKSKTDYGRFKTNGEVLDNLFEILIGKCSIFKEELRAPRASYDAQLFNFLNDLNNLIINNEKLTKEDKLAIYHHVMNSKSVNMINFICKLKNVTKEQIEGYRIDPNGKPLFHKFEIYKNFMNQLEKRGIDSSMIDITSYNKISRCLTLETSKARKEKVLKEELPELKIEVIKAIIELDDSHFSKWHSLSYKAMNEIIDDLWNTSLEQHTLFLQHNLIKENYEIYQGKKNIPTDFIDMDIMNPIARRSIRQAIKMINALRKKYGEFSHIIIEMARELSTDPKEIQKEQKRNMKEKEEAVALVKEYGYTLNSIPNELLTMLRLWKSQDGKCIYSHKSISIDDLINNHYMFQIDHIIPKSISFDDSMKNKVLCYSSENQKKGVKIPSRYFASGMASISYEEYKNYVLDLFERNLITNAKKELLLYDKDITKYEVRRGFINRNLQDTRYATRVVLNTLQNYMKANNIKTSIFTVKGAYTSKIRNRWNLSKDRTYYKHHAVDALIVAASNKAKLYYDGPFYNYINSFLNNEKEENLLIHNVIDDTTYDEIVYSEPYSHFIKNLKELNPKISHKVDTKINRVISDATIKSSRIINGHEYKITKSNNIYEQDGEKIKKKILENPEQLLMYYHDRQTFDYLEEIVKHYADAKNPFLEYYKEHGAIRKYSKKGNGPVITSVKYLNGKLGIHLSIRHKYKDTKNNVFLSTLKPYRIDVYQNDKGKYKFITITNSMFSFHGDKLQLEKSQLELEKNKKKITDDYQFQFSLYKGDCFEIMINDHKYTYSFLGIQSDKTNKIECTYVEKQRRKEERIFLSIGPSVKEFRKYYTDILGNKYYSKSLTKCNN